MSGLISSYFGILRRQDTYFQINTCWGTPTILSPPAAVRVRGSHAFAPLVDGHTRPRLADYRPPKGKPPTAGPYPVTRPSASRCQLAPTRPQP